MSRLLKSYFFWTYSRGSLHYDVMVSLILAFIFITPHVWDFGDQPPSKAGPAYPIRVVGDDNHGLILTVDPQNVSVQVDTPASVHTVRQALRKAIEPVTGDAVFVERWQTETDTDGRIMWKVWAHK